MTKPTKDEASKIASELLTKEKTIVLANAANQLVGYIGYLVPKIRTRAYSDSKDFHNDTEGLYNLADTLNTICHVSGGLDAQELIGQYSDELDNIRMGLMENDNEPNNN